MFFTKWALIRRHPEGDGSEGGSPTPTKEDDDDKVERTKQFAARLKVKTEKAVEDERERIAKELGYSSYKEMRESKLADTVRKETSYDPTEEDFEKLVKIIENTKDEDPEKAKLQAKLEAYEAKEAQRWEQEQIALLESEYGVKVKSLADLDEKVLARIEKGVDPVDAYYLVHKPKPKAQTKDHLVPDPKGTAGAGGKVTVSAEELARFREFSPDLTDEQIVERVALLRGQQPTKK